jgi:hypothetical protein
MHGLKGPTPEQTRGRVYRSFAVVLAIAALAMLAGAQSSPDGSTLFVTGLLSIAVAAVLELRAQRHLTPLAADVLAKDDRPPVIYLRGFQDEVRERGVGELLAVLWQRPVATEISAWGPREQIEIAKVMQRIGPYIALGRPGEKLPEVGAAKLYVADADWQPKILEWLKKARLVVLQAGVTPGLRWEIGQMVKRLSPAKLLVILPDTDAQYRQFKAWADAVLPKALPDMPKARLLMFGDDWTPTTLPDRGSLLTTLQPFLRRNGIALESR